MEGLPKKPKEQPGYVALPTLLKRLRQALAHTREGLDAGNLEEGRQWLAHAEDILDGKATW